MLGLCNDPSTSFLAGKGYNVVRVPNALLSPLDVLVGESNAGRLERTGSIKQYFATDMEVVLPEPKSSSSPDISGTESQQLRLSFGLKILGNLLSSLGIGDLLPQFKSSNAKSLEFKFSNVTLISTDAAEVSTFLQNSDLIESDLLDRFYAENELRMLVVTETLNSLGFQVTARSEQKHDLSLDIPTGTNVADVKIEASSQTSSSISLTFEGNSPLAFGFKAFDLGFAKGRWQLGLIEPGGAHLGGTAKESSLEPIILSPTAGLINVTMNA